MKTYAAVLVILMAMVPAAYAPANGHGHDNGCDGHFDIAPYLIDGKLLTGGLDHDMYHTPPPITVYGYEFGKDQHDPLNPSEPGIFQEAGVGDLPAGAGLSYNILSDLLYWDGSGQVSFGSPGDAYIELWVGPQKRDISADSGPQTGSHVDTVHSDGSLHSHFTTSLYAQPGAGNVPGWDDFVAPPEGIYAFSIDLVLNDNGNYYNSDPLWIVFNNGLEHHALHEAMEVIPEPATLGLLAGGGIALLKRRRR